MAQPSRKDNRSQIKPAMEKVELATLAPLPAGATNAERESYIKALHDSLLLCKGRHLEYAWYIGRELPPLKAKLRLEGERWNKFCDEAFKIGDRQARAYIKIAVNFPTKADLARLLKKADSIRQAVALAEQEEERKHPPVALGTAVVAVNRAISTPAARPDDSRSKTDVPEAPIRSRPFHLLMAFAPNCAAPGTPCGRSPRSTRRRSEGC